MSTASPTNPTASPAGSAAEGRVRNPLNELTPRQVAAIKRHYRLPMRMWDHAEARMIRDVQDRGVCLQNLYRGGTAFLMGGGSSLTTEAKFLLQTPGCLRVAMNRHGIDAHPHLWVCSDPPCYFHRSIWMDPAITKLAPMEYMIYRLHEAIDAPFMKECPNVLGYWRGWTGGPEPRCSPISAWVGDDHGDTPGVRSTMLAALQLLVELGVGTIVLVGVDFDAPHPALPHYWDRLNEHVQTLMATPRMKDVAVLQTNPDSGLRGLPTTELAAEVQRVTEALL